MQTSTIVVRGLSSGDLAALDILQVFFREFRVASIVALICALIAGSLAFALLLCFKSADVDAHYAVILALAVGLATLCTILLSTLLGLYLPYFFRKIGIDPAISSGPLVTTTNDIISYITYFSLALLLINLMA